MGYVLFEKVSLMPGYKVQLRFRMQLSGLLVAGSLITRFDWLKFSVPLYADLTVGINFHISVKF